MQNLCSCHSFGDSAISNGGGSRKQIAHQQKRTAAALTRPRRINTRFIINALTGLCGHLKRGEQSRDSEGQRWLCAGDFWCDLRIETAFGVVTELNQVDAWWNLHAHIFIYFSQKKCAILRCTLKKSSLRSSEWRLDFFIAESSTEEAQPGHDENPFKKVITVQIL